MRNSRLRDRASKETQKSEVICLSIAVGKECELDGKVCTAAPNSDIR